MGLQAVRVNDQELLQQQAGPDTLLWINRVLDGSFSAEDGVELVEQLAAQEPPPAMMLITNYPDVQAKATSAGAMEGFGKSDIGDPALTLRLRGLNAQKA
jgi:hypothetical protein